MAAGTPVALAVSAPVATPVTGAASAAGATTMGSGVTVGTAGAVALELAFVPAPVTFSRGRRRAAIAHVRCRVLVLGRSFLGKLYFFLATAQPRVYIAARPSPAHTTSVSF